MSTSSLSPPKIGTRKIPTKIMSMSCSWLMTIKGITLEKKRINLEEFMAFSLEKVPSLRSVMKSVAMGMVTKNMAKTIQAGTFCCVAVGLSCLFLSVYK